MRGSDSKSRPRPVFPPVFVWHCFPEYINSFINHLTVLELPVQQCKPQNHLAPAAGTLALIEALLCTIWIQEGNYIGTLFIHKRRKKEMKKVSSITVVQLRRVGGGGGGDDKQHRSKHNAVVLEKRSQINGMFMIISIPCAVKCRYCMYCMLVSHNVI